MERNPSSKHGVHLPYISDVLDINPEHEKHTHEESICDDASTLRGVKSSQHHALRTMARAQLALGAFPSIWKRWSFAARVARLETMGTKPGQ